MSHNVYGDRRLHNLREKTNLHGGIFTNLYDAELYQTARRCCFRIPNSFDFRNFLKYIASYIATSPLHCSITEHDANLRYFRHVMFLDCSGCSRSSCNPYVISALPQSLSLHYCLLPRTLPHCGITQHDAITTSFPPCHHSRLFWNLPELMSYPVYLRLSLTSFSLTLCRTAEFRSTNHNTPLRHVTPDQSL
jgi:hypothetical protein